MKNVLWICPAVLAAALGFWLLKSGREVRGLQSQVEEVKTQMADAGQQRRGESGTQEMPSDERSSTGRVITQKNRVNWRALSAMLTAMNVGDEPPDSRQAFESLRVKLDAMDKAELHAALDEINALGFGAQEKSALEAMVLEWLMAKDPQSVLARFEDRIGNDDDQVGFILSEAMGHWANKEPMAAAAWMDQKIKEGKFDSKSLDGYSESRVEFESVLMARLLGVQNMQAVERIRALPENNRLTVLEQMDLASLGPEAQIAYADIVRSLVPKTDRDGAFGYLASELVYEGGYETVLAFLDRVKATPAERAKAAQDAAQGRFLQIAEEGKPTVSDIEAMRKWVQAQAPEQVDRITGEAIGEAYDQQGYLTFEEARKLVLDTHSKSGNDDVLIGFVSSFAGHENPQEAKKLVEMIKDPVKRQQLLEAFE